MRKLIHAALPVAAAATALTLTATNALAAVYESSAQYASYSTGGYTIYNDEWGSGHGTQTLWVNSATNWGVYSTQPDTSGVKSYANESKSMGTVTLAGSTWSLYSGNNGSNPTYSLVRSGNETSGTVNLLYLLQYLENTKGYFSDPTLSTVQYGWEISSTGDTQENFTINSYSVSTS